MYIYFIDRNNLNVMKKFYMILAALLIGSVCFAQTKGQLTSQPFKKAVEVSAANTKAVTGTLQYCGDLNEGNGIGTGGSSTLSAAARFEASSLTSYVGQYITKINVGIDNASVISSAKVAIMTGSIDAPVVALEQACSFQTGMNEVLLSVPYHIPASTDIMVAYEIVVTGGYPLGVDAGPAVTNGDLLCIGALGTALESMSAEYNLDYNNVISATVEDAISTNPIMSVSPSQMGFVGYVGDATTASQQANVSALNLTGNINITTAAPFEVSANNTTFGTTATLTEGGSLYVRYIPANAEALNVTGNVTIASAGAESQTIALTANTYDCTAAISAPWTETFEANSASLYCWSIDNHNADDVTYGRGDLGDNFVMYIGYTEAGNDDYLISPMLHITENNLVTFKVAHRDNSYPETYEVYAIVGGEMTLIRNAAQTTTVAPEFELISVDMSAYAGQNIQVAIRNTSVDAYYFFVDDFSLILAPTTPEIALTSVEPATGTTVQTGQNINISGVVTNNGTTLNSYRVSYSVDGGAAVVYNVSGINVAMGGTHSFTHATPVVLSTAGTHTIVVTVSNPNGAADGDASDNSMTITINAISCDPITTFPYTEDFENGINQCWTLIDADGDGYNWRNSSEAMAEGYGHNASVNAIVSASYANSTALNPDNWAISPAITLPANHYVELSFFAAVQDTSYSAEHYGVYVSTTTTNPSAFSLIWEETMDADGGSHSKAQGTWREKHADLSNYAGQTIYVAFRHFNCTDQFYMLIDDININTSSINQYTITAISANSSMGTVTGGGTYPEGSSVVLSATANAGYRFARWNDGNTSNPRTITVTGDATYTATFETIPSYTITAVSANENMGTVTGGGTYTDGSSVVLRATANTGYRFVRWNDGNTSNPRTITVTGSATYTAYFEVQQYTITVISANPAQGSVSGGGTFAAGTQIQISATANDGFRFVSWQDENTENPRTITVTEDKTYIANFETLPTTPQYTITVLSANDAQGTVAGGGTFDEGTEIQISATATAGYRFVRWNDGNTDNPRAIIVAEDKTYIASFEALPQQYTITVMSASDVQGTVAGGGTFDEGTEIQISATANDGFRFAAWNDGNTDNPRTIIVTENKTYIASFEALPQQYTITVMSASDVQGTVAGGGSFDEGTEIQISATANAGYRFAAWNDGNTDNPRTIIVTENKTYIASFEALPQQYTITVMSASEAQGTVSGGGTFDEGTEIQISATANEGFRFVAWNDGNTDNPRTIIVTENKTYIASFEALPQQYTITVMSASEAQGSVAGGGTFDEGTEIQISATANEGFVFVTWNDGNTDNPRTIVVTGDATYIASFGPASGIEGNETFDISLYPNPASDILNITSSEEISEIEIVNVMGQVVFRMEVNGDNAVCDVNGLANGTYIVRIHTTNAGTISHRKFVKE